MLALLDVTTVNKRRFLEMNLALVNWTWIQPTTRQANIEQLWLVSYSSLMTITTSQENEALISSTWFLSIILHRLLFPESNLSANYIDQK